jgi:predicted dehydrogenase
MSSDEVRLGLIGCGSHANMAILPALRFSQLQLAAVCDIDAELARQTARRFGASASYVDYATMLRVEDLDVVAVIGPPALHHAAGLAVLASGRHLFVEKPPAPTLEQAAELAAAAGDRQVMVGFQKRHARAYQMAKRVAASPAFGRASMLRIGYSHVRTPGLREQLLEMSIHALDLARFILGDVVSGAVHLSERDENHVIALTLEHEGGAVSMLSLSALEPRLRETVELAGDSTLLRVRDLSELTVQRAAPEWDDTYDTGPEMMSGWRPDFAIPTDYNNSLVLQGYAGEMIELADAILTGRPVRGNIFDGLAAMRLIDAIAQAPLGFSMLDLTPTDGR